VFCPSGGPEQAKGQALRSPSERFFRARQGELRLRGKTPYRAL